MKNLILVSCFCVMLGCATSKGTLPAHPSAMNPLGSPSMSQQVMPALVTLGQDQDLQTIVAQSPGTVLIDFYADWCGPCQKQGQILHQVESTAAQNSASIIKVNIDQHPALAEQFEVSSLPTLMLVRDGQIVDRRSGVADHQTLTQMLSR